MPDDSAELPRSVVEAIAAELPRVYECHGPMPGVCCPGCEEGHGSGMRPDLETARRVAAVALRAAREAQQPDLVTVRLLNPDSLPRLLAGVTVDGIRLDPADDGTYLLAFNGLDDDQAAGAPLPG